jgi:TolB protein
MRLSRVAVAGVALLTTLAPGPVAQEEREFGGTIVGTGAQRIVIGLPALRVQAALSSGAAAELRQVIADDLDFSRYFRVLSRDEPAVDPDAPRLGAWATSGASQVLVLTVLPGSGDDFVLEGRLYEMDLADGGLTHRMALGKRYAAPPAALRRLAHRMADEIVEAITGQRGIARTRFAYSARTSGTAKEIFIADYDGARARQITRGGGINLSPVWSPDGHRLAFLSFRAGDPTVFLLSESGDVTQVRLGGGTLNGAPDWSPDGRKLAFSTDRDRNSEVYVHRLDTGRQTRLTRNPAIDTAPEWSPDGMRIAFTSDRGGSPQIYVMDSAGGDVRRISYEGSYSDSAAWSPRGDRLAYVARIAGQFEIVWKDLETGESRVITSGGGHQENPRWSPDGRHLVFASNRGTGRYALYTIHEDGTGLRLLSRGAEAFTPDWSP